MAGLDSLIPGPDKYKGTARKAGRGQLMPARDDGNLSGLDGEATTAMVNFGGLP